MIVGEEIEGPEPDEKIAGADGKTGVEKQFRIQLGDAHGRKISKSRSNRKWVARVA